MDLRASIRRFSVVVVLCAVGVAIAFSTSGRTGDLVGWGLVGVGLIGAVSLLFYEVGLSEDREREQRPGG
jgi:hypothetical protein